MWPVRDSHFSARAYVELQAPSSGKWGQLSHLECDYPVSTPLLEGERRWGHGFFSWKAEVTPSGNPLHSHQCSSPASSRPLSLILMALASAGCSLEYLCPLWSGHRSHEKNHIWLHTPKCVYMHSHTCTWTHTLLHTHVHTHVLTHAHIWAYIHAHTYLHICAHTYMLVHTYEMYGHTIKKCIRTLPFRSKIVALPPGISCVSLQLQRVLQSVQCCK